MMPLHNRATPRGFTLIEVIVSIIIAAIFGTVLVQFFYSTVAGSVEPVNNTRNINYAQAVMESIGAEYIKLVATDASPLTSLQTAIGTQGSSKNNAFGVYSVIRNQFITIDGNSNILKVKIEARGIQLASLFGG